MPHITAPNRDYTGISAGVAFAKGQADTDDPAAIAYFRNAGYGIDAEPATKSAETSGSFVPEPSVVQLGSPLRDAAVDPMPEDFLPPVNAGEADPHGPLVVSPEIHASNTGPIRPGDVHVEDTPVQEAQESALAEAVLVDNQDVPQATAEAARANDAAPADLPSRSANKATWVDFAVDRGMDRDAAEDLTIAALRERFQS